MCVIVWKRSCLSYVDRTNQHSTKFFNNKEKGDRIRDQKIIIHIPSHLKHSHTHLLTHTLEYLQNFITIYMYTCLVYTHTNNNELSSYRQAHVVARALNSCILNMCVYTQFICICVYHWIYMWRYHHYFTLSLLFLMMVLKKSSSIVTNTLSLILLISRGWMKIYGIDIFRLFISVVFFYIWYVLLIFDRFIWL